jgi:hypothetical protein
MKHYINYGSVSFFIDITFSETKFQNETYIKLIQNIENGYNGMQTPTLFAKCIKISQKLMDINLSEKTHIDLDGLIHNGKKIVAVNYAKVTISGKDKIAMQLINYKSKWISMTMNLPINMPVFEPELNDYGLPTGGSVLTGTEELADEEIEHDMNLVLDQNSLLILSFTDFVNRVYNG